MPLTTALHCTIIFLRQTTRAHAAAKPAKEAIVTSPSGLQFVVRAVYFLYFLTGISMREQWVACLPSFLGCRESILAFVFMKPACNQDHVIGTGDKPEVGWIVQVRACVRACVRICMRELTSC